MTCTICTDPLIDPRPLPCGHSYCGPPKTCLTFLEKTANQLTCAQCNQSFMISIPDLKPLYEIREVLQNQLEEKSNLEKEIALLRNQTQELCNYSQKFIPPGCAENACANASQIWCKQCEVPICDDCLEISHDRHSVSMFKKFLQKAVGEKLKFVTKIELDDSLNRGW